MLFAKHGRRLIGISIAALLLASAASALRRPASAPLVTSRVDPDAFGLRDETTTPITAASFTAITAAGKGLDIGTPVDLRTFSRFCNDCSEDGVQYFATLDLPAGALIDFLGINTASDVDETFILELFERNPQGHVAGLVGFSVPAHGLDTDFDGPLNIPIPNNSDHQFVILVEQQASPNPQFFGGVEVRWHRTVSAAPEAATFGDVPTSHPFYQFVEALAASGISGGCGGGNFCPDAPVTRGQMAVFLAKALGLHFPN
jgi:hypothetical protein